MDQTFLVLFAGATVIVIAGAIAIFAAIIWRSIRLAQPKRPVTPLETDRARLAWLAADETEPGRRPEVAGPLR
jgi:hypothetical protein